MKKRMPAVSLLLFTICFLSVSLSPGQDQAGKKLICEQVYEQAEPQLTAFFQGISGAKTTHPNRHYADFWFKYLLGW